MNYQIAKQKIIPNSGKLPLKEYYNSLSNRQKSGYITTSSKTFFLQKVSEIVGRPITTLRRWVAGTSTPAPLEQQAIAKLVNSSVETLFPETV